MSAQIIQFPRIHRALIDRTPEAALKEGMTLCSRETALKVHDQLTQLNAILARHGKQTVDIKRFCWLVQQEEQQ